MRDWEWLGVDSLVAGGSQTVCLQSSGDGRRVGDPAQPAFSSARLDGAEYIRQR
jgi:hypothetical protein